ncbi:glycosyltransferase [Streptomyces sp. NPDC005438]|uniref:glycosyltransferase n=1 Tax=Streptomyces sp. NPDC005438 TaxID=3156880 RepID=UPI0033A2FF70
MRVVLSTYGSRGDVEPLVGLAEVLRARGAETRVCAPRDEDFAGRLSDIGVPWVPVGPSARDLTAAPSSPSSLPEVAAALIAEQFEVVGAAAEGCDVVVATGMLPAAAGALSVAELLGVRAVSATFQQLTLPSPYRSPLAYPGRPFPPGVTDPGELWELDARSADALFGEALNSARTRHGLPAVERVRDYGVGAVGGCPWLATDPVLDPWRPTSWLDVVQTGAWTVPDERPLPAEVSAFLEAGRPPVYVGFGSMPLHRARDLAQVAVEAAHTVGRRLVLGRGWADLGLVDHGDDHLVVGEVNHQALFGRVAAVVHHGGAGTTRTAARAGVPQVVVPQATDQPYWAGRVVELGLGAAHDGPVPTADSLSAALTRALEPGVAARATSTAGALRTDGAEVAAGLLSEVVAGRLGDRRP